MQILIRSKGFALTEAIDNHIRSKVESTFSRLNGVVKTIEVFIKDINGPKGGIDKSCVVKIKTDQRAELVIKDKESDLYVAINRTFARAKRSLVRHAQNARGIKHKRITALLDDQTLELVSEKY